MWTQQRIDWRIYKIVIYIYTKSTLSSFQEDQIDQFKIIVLFLEHILLFGIYSHGKKCLNGKPNSLEQDKIEWSVFSMTQTLAQIYC